MDAAEKARFVRFLASRGAATVHGGFSASLRGDCRIVRLGQRHPELDDKIAMRGAIIRLLPPWGTYSPSSPHRCGLQVLALHERFVQLANLQELDDGRRSSARSFAAIRLGFHKLKFKGVRVGVAVVSVAVAHSTATNGHKWPCMVFS